MSALNTLKNTAFSPSSGSNSENEVKGATKEPYNQFVKCRYSAGGDSQDGDTKDTGETFKCKFIMNDGTCIFETCFYDDHVPPRVMLWYFKCVICDEEDSIKPEEMRVPFCRSCIQRMLRAEKLPHRCVFCGKTVHRPALLMMSGICDECANDMAAIIKFWRGVGRRGWRHTV